MNANSPALHVAIIMDGNGRWATARGRPRSAGHRAGVEAVRRIVEAAPDAGVSTLTLYAFSSDNWRRPQDEIATLMRLFKIYLRRETGRCVEQGVRLTLIGRRDRLHPDLRDTVAEAETATQNGSALHLRIAIDYSSRDAILRAASQLNASTEISREKFSCLIAGIGAPVPDVDLLIRTGGEQRLSDFLLWESAYAELVFLKRMWPDFGPTDLAAAIKEYHSRERRFGALSDGSTSKRC
jgi:undecaprenyl diphosphate synthase